MISKSEHKNCEFVAKRVGLSLSKLLKIKADYTILLRETWGVQEGIPIIGIKWYTKTNT